MDHTAKRELKRNLLQAIWRDKLHVDKDALERSPIGVRESFAHIWEPAQLWLDMLEALPAGLLQLWAEGPYGHLVFTAGPSVYLAGPQPWQGRTLEGLCYLALADVRTDRRRALWTTLALLDHLLGSRGQGALFSQGAGCTTPLQAAAERYVALHALGYGTEEWAAPDAQSYFTHSLEAYLTHPQRLNTLAPQLYRLYRHTLMRESWWPPAATVESP